MFDDKLCQGWRQSITRTGDTGHTLDRMVNKTYLVRLKPPSFALQRVAASRCEIHGEHLVFVDSEGKLVALFLMDLVQSWKVLKDCWPPGDSRWD